MSGQCASKVSRTYPLPKIELVIIREAVASATKRILQSGFEAQRATARPRVFLSAF